MEDQPVQSPLKKLKTEEASGENSPFHNKFLNYREELDKRNDTREQLVKLSRDVTIHSKRVIFSLLRKGVNKQNLVADAKAKISDIKLIFNQINQKLECQDIYRFHRAITPGIQEFIEAISLLHYVETKTVISYEIVISTYFDLEDYQNFVTHLDYMLGVGDLTGELMRMGINSIGSGDYETVNQLCAVMQEIYSNYSIFSKNFRELEKKANVMKNSLTKIENACCNLKIRGSESSNRWLIDSLEAKDMLEE